MTERIIFAIRDVKYKEMYEISLFGGYIFYKLPKNSPPPQKKIKIFLYKYISVKCNSSSIMKSQMSNWCNAAFLESHSLHLGQETMDK